MAYQDMQFEDIGPAELTYNSVVLGKTVANPDGGTHGGTRLRIATEWVDSFRDASGKQPYGKILVGTVITVEANLAGLSLEQIKELIPGAVLSTGPADKQLSIKSGVGTSALTNAKELTIKPLDAGVATTDETKWLTFPKAYPMPDFDLPFNLEDQKVYKVNFAVFPDDTGVFVKIGKDAAS